MTMGFSAKVKALITADSSQYQKSMKNVASATAGASSAMSGLKGMVIGLGIALGSMFAVFKAISFVVNSTKAFIDYEEQLIRTGAIMKNFQLGAEEAAIANAALSAEIRDVAKTSKFTATEVGAMAEVLALAGLSLDDMRRPMEGVDEATGSALKTMVDFAVVAGTDVETAAGIGIASVKGFRLEIGQLENVTSVLTNTFTSSFVNLQQLGDAMRFFGPTAAAAGVSVSEAAAAVGALGDAGLQGSMAGTGLRQAINKLIAPSDDARRTLERLGLEFTTLTPAGLNAQAALSGTIRTIDGLEKTIGAATLELKSLNNELTSMSLEEESNSINIARIRQRASKQNRALTRTEIKTISRLESANEDLALAQREGALEARHRDIAIKDSNNTLSEQEDAFKSFKSTVENQTTGVKSLVSIIDELNASGATTAEILEIFGVRGGGSILALQGNAAAFREIAAANQEAFDVTDMNMTLQDQFVAQMQGSTAFALAETKSKFEELTLVVGEPFALLITQEGGIKQTLDTAIDKAATMGFVFEDIASSVSTNLLPSFKEAFKPENIEKFLEAVQTIVPEIIKIIGVLAKMAAAIEPILDAILGVTNALGLSDVQLEPIDDPERTREDRLIGKEGETKDDSRNQILAAGAVGAGIGATAGLIGGPLAPVTVTGGALAGGAIGLTVGAIHEGFQGLGQGFSDWTTSLDIDMTNLPSGGLAGPGMATGGIVVKPIFNATVGEGGQPEAVIPLDRLPDFFPASFRNNSDSTEQVINLTFDSINIGAGNNITAGDVRQIIESEMPKIIRSSLTRGARGVL